MKLNRNLSLHFRKVRQIPFSPLQRFPIIKVSKNKFGYLKKEREVRAQHESSNIMKKSNYVNAHFSKRESGKQFITEKLSLGHCRKILNRNGKKYSDEQIIEICDFLYKMATVDYLFFTEQYLMKCNNLNPYKHEQESNPLHQGEYRRAS